jgi:DegV family protein with EDD domain
MDYKLVVDSCCDVTQEFAEEHGVTVVPLTITLGEHSITDDDELDMAAFMAQMKRCTGRIGSAAPSPMRFKEAFQPGKTTFAVTLSCNLSGSYSSAMVGKEMAEAEGAEVHVFDSKSASAGEVLVAMKITELMKQGLHKAKLIETVEGFIKQMKTYFVLENIDTLLKNGRISRIKGKLISVLSIKPIMGSDGDGNIALFSHARGQKQVIDRLTDTIQNSGRGTNGESLVIAHCNNPGLAGQLKEAIRNRYRFSNIIIVPMRGISTVYANDRGIVMAF